MKNIGKRLAAISLVIIMLFGTISFNASAASTTVDLNAQPISAIQSALNNAASGDTITVTGSTTVSTGYVFTINAGVTVNWQAALTGAVSPATAFMIILNGGGTFNVGNGGSINNIGTGGTINVSGAGMTLNVQSGGEILAERSGSAINIAALNVTLNVNNMGSITNTGTTSAVNVMTQLANVKINVNGGSISSAPTGNAINDSGGDTHIIVSNGGIVTAGAARAIWSQGTDSLSTVLVDGGVVVNAAGNNLNPAIDMSGVQGNLSGGNWNVVVKGTGVVRSTSPTGFALQTRGNVLVCESGQVISINGRAINIVGASSNATIRDSASVSTTGTGTAISTATTNPQDLPNTSVRVEGGMVSAVSGNAINITGVSSSVVVTGGIVSSVSGNAINADTGLVSSNPASNTYASFSIIVSGGSVSSSTGYAIQNLGGGPSSRVIVSDTANGLGGSGGPGGQVSVFTNGAAIRAPNGTVIVNGGFVFAYGSTYSTTISARSITWPISLGGQIGLWNQAAATAAGRSVYGQGTTVDLALYFGSPTNLQWYFNPKLGSGIYYVNGRTAGFFPLSQVMVSYDYALIFDSYNGKMYRDAGNSTTPMIGYEVTVGHSPMGVDPTLGAWWATYNTNTGGYDLHLSGFSWTTVNANRALTILKSDGVHDTVTVFLNGNSLFDSRASEGTGITIGNSLKINIDGSGTLIARGNSNDGIGLELGGSNTVLAAYDDVIVQDETLNDEIDDIEHDDSEAISAITDTNTEQKESEDDEIIVNEEEVQEREQKENFDNFDSLDNEIDTEHDNSENVSITRNNLIMLEDTSDELVSFATGDPGSIIITHGELIAQGGNRAVNWSDALSQSQWQTGIGSVPAISLHYRWKWSMYFDGREDNSPGPSDQGNTWDSGFGGENDVEFIFYDTDKYVRLTALQTVTLVNSVQIGGVSNLADSIAIELTFDKFISDLVIDDIIIINQSGAATRGATLTGSGNKWIVWLEGVQAQGIVNVTIANQIIGFFVEESLLPTEVYKETSFDMVVSSTAGGIVEGNGTGWYQVGFPISITAIANDGYHFTGWVVNGATLDNTELANLATFTMPANNVMITANFVPNPPDTFTLNVISSDGGIVIGTISGAYAEGSAIEVRALANDGYHFTGWVIEGAQPNNGLESPLVTFDMPANMVTLIAMFELNPFGTYTLNVLCSEGGTVSGTPSGAYLAGYEVNVTAVADDGYHFTGWTIESEDLEIESTLVDANIQLEMPANMMTLIANFAINDNDDLPVERSPQTGVNHNLFIPIVLLVIGITIIVGTELHRRRQGGQSK